MAWTTLHLQVTTPLFNGGDGTDAGIRPPSLRGLLRYWFRTLAGITAGPDLDALAALEARVFGDTENSSPLRLRIPAQPAVEPAGAPDWCNKGDDGQALLYLLGQGLAKPVRDPRRGGWPYRCTLQRPYVAAGAEFDLQFTHRDPDAAVLLLASLWLMTTYGGLGARTHRGWGGLRILGHTGGPLPPPWTSASVITPDRSFYRGLTRLWPGDDPIGAVMPVLSRISAAVRKQPGTRMPIGWADQDRPTYPVLSRTHTPAATFADRPDATQALADAGDELRWFRGNVDKHDAPYRPRVETSEWVHTIHGDDNTAPLATLGLPLNYPGHTVNATAGDTPLRRASPLWIRPVSDPDGWSVLTFAFRGTFLPRTVNVEATSKHRTRRLTVTDEHLDDTVSQWIDVHRAGGTFIRTRTGAARRTSRP